MSFARLLNTKEIDFMIQSFRAKPVSRFLLPCGQ